MTTLGSLVIYSERAVPEFDFLDLSDMHKREGHHVNGKYNGSYREYFDTEPVEVLLPQRYKRMTVLADDSIKHELAAALTTMDSKYGEARQLYKLGRMMEELDGVWSAVVNITNTSDTSASGAFYLMASGSPLHLALVFDSDVGSIQLVWATFDVRKAIQESGIRHYSAYPLPALRDRPLFVPSTSLCSKWWRWKQNFEQHRFAHLRAANALELILYKDPNLRTLPDGLRRNSVEA
jgi:hypothetical protein